MIDYFALLESPRQPWLDPEAVQARFLQLSAPVHPDRVHGQSDETVREANQRFAQLNQAASTLRDPKERLQHLLQLETGAAPPTTQSIPPELFDLVTRLGQTCRSVDQFLAERAKATSPMLQAQFFGQALDWTDRVTELQNHLAQLRQTAEADLKSISAHWPSEKPIPQLQKLAHLFATANRWEAQLKERYAALAT